MHTLTINADDFGMSDGVVSGIIETMEHGVLHSTSAMVCDPEDRRRVEASAGRIAGRVGLHLQLTDGPPLSPPETIRSLVDDRFRFPGRPERVGTLDPAEVLAEWRAQLDCLRGLGVEPSHIDSHHHVHTLPGAAEAYVELAREAGVRARGYGPLIVRRLRAAGVDCVDACEVAWTGSVEALVGALGRLAARLPGPSRIELVSHPAHVDDTLRARSRSAESRGVELRTLQDPDLIPRLLDIGVQVAPTGRVRPG